MIDIMVDFISTDKSDIVFNYMPPVFICMALFQPTAQRSYAVLCFSLMMLIQNSVSFVDSNFIYFTCGSLLALLTIFVTSAINPLPEMVVKLHDICIAIILANCIGWVSLEMWGVYVPYKVLFFLIYIKALCIFIQRNGDDIGDHGIDSWRDCFRINSHARNYLRSKNQGYNKC